MALPQDTFASPDIGTAPPWLRQRTNRQLPAANDFDSQLASLHSGMNALGPSPTDPGRGGGAMSPDWTPNANVQAMFPGMGPSNQMVASDPARGGIAGAAAKSMTTPGPQAMSRVEAPPITGPTQGGSLGNMSAPYAPPSTQPAAPTAPPSDPFAEAQAAYNAAISGNHTADTRPLWMIQRDQDLANEASGTPPTAPASGPAAGPAAPAAAPPPSSVMTPLPGSTPGVTVTGQAPWEGANPITRTRVNDTALPAVDQDFSEQARLGADAAYKGATQYFDEDFARERAGLENQLINQGFARGTEGFDAELGKMMRSQNAARENAGFVAQGVGHAQAGDLLQRALASRAALMGERERDADRTFGQGLGIAGLSLGARAQDKGVEQASLNSAGASASAGASLAASKYSTDASTNLALRQLGLSEDAQGFNQLMQLVAASRGGVNMPNFGSPAPLDVTGANQIASSNSNNALNRDASNRAALYQLGGAALGSMLR